MMPVPNPAPEQPGPQPTSCGPTIYQLLAAHDEHWRRTHPNQPTPNIHKPIFEIIRILDLEPEHVRSLEFTPSRITATMYALNDAGHKHLDDNGEAAVYTLIVPVDTRDPLHKTPA